MLKPVTPPDPKSLSEAKKLTGYFGKLTGERGDIKVFKSTGKGERTFLRLWVGEAKRVTGTEAGSQQSGPQWFEIVSGEPEETATPLDTK